MVGHGDSGAFLLGDQIHQLADLAGPRARGAREDSSLGEVLLEVNSLGETLRQQRLGAFEATALLRTIMSEIDVAIFTFDPERRLRLINRAGETLLWTNC